MTYLDSAATGFLKPMTVKREILWALDQCASPGRGGYHASLQAAETIYRCRELCGELFSCRPDQVVFTSGATHGLNIAIKDLVKAGDRVVISGFEHNAVLRPLFAIGADVCTAGTVLFDQQNTLEAFQTALTADTKAVVCTHVSNVFGYILPVEGIAQMCREREIPLIVDASQSAGTLPVSLDALDAAYIALPGHKGLMGPQGIGVLLCGRTPRTTLIEGGTGSRSRDIAMPDFLPDRLEAGTCNVPGIAGLSAGVQYVLKTGTDQIFSHEKELLKFTVSELCKMDGVRCFAGEPQAGVLSLQINGEDSEVTAERLAEAGIAVRAGLHCSPLAHHSAGTLDMGTVRISFSPFSIRKDAEQLLHGLRVRKKLKRASKKPL